MRTTAEAVRLPRSKMKERDEKQGKIEEIHDIDNHNFDYIVAPYKDPDVTGRNNQTVDALGANTPGNGYNIVVNNDYYGDGTHALIARPKSAAKDEHRERVKQFPKLPKGTLKTTVNEDNFIIRESQGEKLKPGRGDFGDEARDARNRRAQVEESPENMAVLEKMTGGVTGIEDELED